MILSFNVQTSFSRTTLSGLSCFEFYSSIVQGIFENGSMARKFFFQVQLLK